MEWVVWVDRRDNQTFYLQRKNWKKIFFFEKLFIKNFQREDRHEYQQRRDREPHPLQENHEDPALRHHRSGRRRLPDLRAHRCRRMRRRQRNDCKRTRCIDTLAIHCASQKYAASKCNFRAFQVNFPQKGSDEFSYTVTYDVLLTVRLTKNLLFLVPLNIAHLQGSPWTRD